MESPTKKPPFLAMLRELARAYQAFEAYSAIHIRQSGLTAPQFDVIATLGNTEGMTFKMLGEKTLTTKGTLTGIVDRLVEKKLVKRVNCARDRRIVYASLTSDGQKLFEEIFPAHMEYLDQRLQSLSAQDMEQYRTMLGRIEALFASRQKDPA